MRSIKKYGETVAYELSNIDVERLQDYLCNVLSGIDAYKHTKDRDYLENAYSSAEELAEYFRDIWNYE